MKRPPDITPDRLRQRLEEARANDSALASIEVLMFALRRGREEWRDVEKLWNEREAWPSRAEANPILLRLLRTVFFGKRPQYDKWHECPRQQRADAWTVSCPERAGQQDSKYFFGRVMSSCARPASGHIF